MSELRDAGSPTCITKDGGVPNTITPVLNDKTSPNQPFTYFAVSRLTWHRMQRLYIRDKILKTTEPPLSNEKKLLQWEKRIERAWDLVDEITLSIKRMNARQIDATVEAIGKTVKGLKKRDLKDISVFLKARYGVEGS